jgi:diguanylate cyclase (GGDEF)-like protein/PAS domain S-box-containing protein
LALADNRHMPSRAARPLPRAFARLRASLPSGKTLPPEIWQRRHHTMVVLAWLHVPALLIFGVARGYPLLHVAVDVTPIVVFASAAMLQQRSMRFRACMVALALLSSSAALVHLSGGSTEAHFHFFVMVTVLACYEEWLPYLLAIGYVLLHHGLMGVLVEPTAVFDHGSDPWKWAAIHAGFIAGLCVVNVLSWRMNEDARAERAEALEQTIASEARFRGTFEDAPIGMGIVETDGRFARVNGSLCATTGYSEENLLGMRIQDLADDPERDGWTNWAGEEIEARFRRADGSVGWALWRHSLVSGEEGERYVSQLMDVSEHKEAEERLAFQAHHDVLTGLPNRVQFVHRLADSLAARHPAQGHVAVCYLDLDNFKVINDSLGHEAGDRLLMLAADRLADALRPGDVVARMGGDEFTVLLRDVIDESDALQVAERLVDVLRPAFVLDGELRYLTASVGLTVTGDRQAAPDDMLRDADIAMYRAKERGKSQCALYDDSLRARSIERLELEGGLRHALERNELVLAYQPEVSLATGRIVAVEALLRWHHPTRGIVSPANFIPIAEQSGLIVPIGEWVLREACRTAAAWRRDTSVDDLTVAVNLSPRQLGTVNLVDVVSDALDQAGLPASSLCLEVTETALMADMDLALEALARLKQLGVQLAIDDFGIGYSSLKHLKQLLPVDIIKIDKSFVDGMVKREDDRAIVEAVVRLASALHVDAIAEGVEHADQAAALRLLSCTYAQGYHFARPQPAADVHALLAAQAAAAASS